MGLLDSLMGGGSEPSFKRNPAYTMQSPYTQDIYSTAQSMFNKGAGAAPAWASGTYQGYGQGTNPIMQQLQGTATGQYLNANPYIDRMFNQAATNVTDQYRNAVVPGIRSQFGLAGGYNRGSEGNALGQSQQNLGSTLGNLATNIYGGNYANERGMMNQAANQFANMQMMGTQGAQDVAMDPWKRFQMYQQAIGAPQQAYFNNPQAGNQGGNPLMGALGGAAVGSQFGPWGTAGGALLGFLGSR